MAQSVTGAAQSIGRKTRTVELAATAAKGGFVLFDVRLEPAFHFLSEEYGQLFERASATAFQHPIWLHRLYRDLAPRLGAEPLIVAARRRGTGELAMVLPLVRRKRGSLRVIEFADLEVSDYAAPVCDPAALGELASERVAREVRAQLRPFDLVRVKKLVDGAPALDRLLGLGQRSQLPVSAHAVRLYEPFAQWRSDNIEDSYRRELEKKRRKLERRGEVRFELVEDRHEVVGAFEMLRDQRKERFPDDRLQDPVYFEFYVNLALQGRESGFARTYVMWLDGERIGGAFGLAHAGQFLLVLSGAAIGEYKRLSVGSLVFEDVARDGLAKGDAVLDFTIGDESYKQLFGAAPSPLWMVSGGATATGKLALIVGQSAPWARRIAAGQLAARTQTPATAES